MDFLPALVLGVVEGLTEFLPISSTGHLILVGHAIGFSGSRAASFEVFIQLGAILAIVWLYRKRFIQLFHPEPTDPLSGLSGWKMLLLTSLPAALAGFLFHSQIKEYLFRPMTVALGLVVGGIALIIIERNYKNRTAHNLQALTKKQALKIGLFQVLSLWPGVSRAGATIIGGMVSGLDRKSAVEYSFLAAVPLMIAATGYDLLKSLPDLQPSDAPFFALGFIVAFLSALVAVKFLVKYVQRRTMESFGWYRLILAALVYIFLR